MEFMPCKCEEEKGYLNCLQNKRLKIICTNTDQRSQKI